MLRSKISLWREYLTPIQHDSKYKENGTITPDEFVLAGDYLQNMFPTWKWNGDDPDINVKNLQVKDFLPSGKQFLVTRKVVCDKRVDVPMEDFEVNDELVDIGATNEDSAVGNDNIDDNDGEEGWIIENLKHLSIKPISNDDTSNEQPGTHSHEEEDVEEITEDYEDEIQEDYEEPYEEGYESLSNLGNSSKRYYDLYITYSTSYRVPKIYLIGFNSDGLPLAPQDMMDDINKDYRSKTATIENIPLFKGKVTSVSIHPCKHSNVMRMLMNKKLEDIERLTKKKSDTDDGDVDNEDDDEEQAEDEEEEEGLRVDHYLVIFLKFISSVVPTIQYDFTMEGL